jgi:hypothetical protein
VPLLVVYIFKSSYQFLTNRHIKKPWKEPPNIVFRRVTFGKGGKLGFIFKENITNGCLER